MIFVTVGTHEEQFNRLVEYMDKLRGANIIDEDVIIQTGFSTYEPKNCRWQKLYPYHTMIEMVEKARIVITHGGPSSFFMPLQVGKIPIVVPRQKAFGEHVNNHQLDFARKVAQRQKSIIVIENIEDLKHTILNYEDITKLMSPEITSNNAAFNDNFKQIVNEIFEKRKKP